MCIRWNTVIIIACLVCSGCANRHTLAMGDQPAGVSVSSMQLACSVTLSVNDERTRKTSYGKTISSDSLIQWVESRFFQVIEAPSSLEKPEYPALDIQVDVRKAYIHHITTSHSAIVAVDVVVGENSHYLRSRETGILWSGVRGEYIKQLNGALDKTLHQIAELASTQCDKASVASYPG